MQLHASHWSLLSSQLASVTTTITMPSLKSILATAAFASLAHAKTIRVTATDDNKFDPNDIKADKDDVVEFVFEPKNHSVVAGSYDFPCSPLQIGEGFWSGFIDSDDGEAVRSSLLIRKLKY